MNDPVIGSDGNSYERAAITQWLRTNPHSPLTRQPMTVGSLKPNFALRTTIERYKNPPRQQQRTMASAPPTEYRPILIPTAPPIGPPMEDVYYAFQVHQQVNVQPQVSAGAQDARRKKFISVCLCLTFVIVIVIIISRLASPSN
jgi:hypothetical protein